MFHVLAYQNSIGGGAYTSLLPIPDTVFGTNVAGTRFVYGRELQLFAGQVFCDGTPCPLVGARVSTPSMANVGRPMLRPWTAFLAAQNDPNLATFLDRPPRLPRAEEINLEANATDAANSYGFLWVAEGLQPAPPKGDIITVSGVSSDSSLSGAWSEISLSWQESLQNGTYVVVGSEHISATALAHRWIFDNQAFRPGGLSQISLGNRTHRLFYDGSLGIWGTFTAQVPPRLQVLSTSNDEGHTAFLQVIRIGD